jgi:hypothetical protein
MTATTGTTGRAPPPAATSDKTTSTSKIAIVAGVFFLITDISAFAGRLLYNPVLSTTRP